MSNKSLPLNFYELLPQLKRFRNNARTLSLKRFLRRLKSTGGDHGDFPSTLSVLRF